MSLDLAIFIVSSLVAVFGATMIIAQRNPVSSVLYFILSLIAQAACYVQLGALFLGAIMIVVYAGAIMVLFLFVIMLLNLRGKEDLGGPSGAVSRFTKYVVALLMTLELLFIVKGVALPNAATGIMSEAGKEFGTVSEVAKLMFTDFLYPFELTGVLLLIAVVGAVVLARAEKRDEQDSDTERIDGEVE